MPFIQVDSHILAFRLRRSARAKRLHMSYRNGEFEVVAPLKRVKNSEVLQFIKTYQGWMLKQLKNKPAKMQQADVWPPCFLSQEEIKFRGNQIKLNVKFGAKKMAMLVEHGLNIMVPWKTTTQDTLESEVKKQVLAFCQHQAMLAVQKALDHFCPQLNRWPSAVRIKQQKTRWGSCGPTDKININWLLILAPIGVLEYVVVHELCHLFHRNHGVRFWAKVEKIMPDYQRFEKWLSQHGRDLIKP